MKNLILISGKIGSGKDTVADQLIKLNRKERWYGLKYWKPKMVKISFADRLKFAAAYIAGSNIADMYSQEGKNLQCQNQAIADQTNGQFLQDFGTRIMRENCHDQIWVSTVLMPKINKFKIFGMEFTYVSKPKKNIIKLIPDCRFKNEAAFGKNNNAVLIRVNGDPIGTRKNSTRDLNHKSETDLDDYEGWDWMIENEGSLEDLYDKVAQINYHIKLHTPDNEEYGPHNFWVPEELTNNGTLVQLPYSMQTKKENAI